MLRDPGKHQVCPVMPQTWSDIGDALQLDMITTHKFHETLHALQLSSQPPTNLCFCFNTHACWLISLHLATNTLTFDPISYPIPKFPQHH